MAGVVSVVLPVGVPKTVVHKPTKSFFSGSNLQMPSVKSHCHCLLSLPLRQSMVLPQLQLWQPANVTTPTKTIQTRFIVILILFIYRLLTLLMGIALIRYSPHFQDFWATFCPVGARRNEIRLVARCAGSHPPASASGRSQRKHAVITAG